MASLPTFERAAAMQCRYASYYTVWLTGPDGTREYLGFTGRKTGNGLMAFLHREGVQGRMRELPGAGDMGFVKRSDCLVFTTAGTPNGWAIRFGGTIREEAAR